MTCFVSSSSAFTFNFGRGTSILICSLCEVNIEHLYIYKVNVLTKLIYLAILSISEKTQLSVHFCFLPT